MQAEALAALTLHFTPGLGPVRIKALVERAGGAAAALALPPAVAREAASLDAATAAGLGAAAPRERAALEAERAARLGLTLLPYCDDRYPEALRAIYDPPPILWVRGGVEPLAGLRGPTPRSFGIVGTRRCSAHARAFTSRLAGDLARAGVLVVSGLARGVDTEAHRAAVQSGGASVAVLGCGADRVYPPENAELAASLTLVSAYPVGTPPEAHNFPARNRIIAGLVSGVAVVEGDLKSGSMITATAALEAGRTVFAVPGRPGEANTAGPHRLLREGAVLCESAEDVLAELGWDGPPARPDLCLEGDQAVVYGALEGALLLDDVVAATALDPSRALAALMLLSLGGAVRELPGGRYSRS
ncbi:MAG TPA: DNA-processing protein DprA [Deinococcales bacterium]|nr:DNA-processing protein DprA [Deinococcales bacterium]